MNFRITISRRRSLRNGALRSWPMAMALVAGSCGGSPTSAPTAVATPPNSSSASVVSVKVSGQAPIVGDSAQFSATASLSDGSQQVVTGLATWGSSNSGVASAISGGTVRGNAVGEADITATYQTVSGQVHVSIGLGVIPGGLAAGQYRFPTSNFDTMDAFITIEIDPGPTSSIFWAHQFFFEHGSGDDGAYLGLQTRGIAFGRDVGKMAIYSVWNAVDAVAGPGATFERFGNEGSGYSIRLPYQYQQGVTYRFRVSREGSGWWGVTLRDMSSGGEVSVGRILGKATWSGLSSYVANFTEGYSRVSSCAALEHARARFDQPAASPPSSLANLFDHHTYGNCVAVARTIASGSTLVHEVGVR